MTIMEATLGWTQVYSFGRFGHVSEPLPNASASSQHVKLLLQTRKLCFSHNSECKGQCTLFGDEFHGLSRQISGSKAASLACFLRQDNVITLPPSLEESSFKLAAENAYKSPSTESSTSSLTESMPIKPHSNKRRFFPANGASVVNGDSHAMFGANPSSASVSGEYPLEYSCGPSDGVVICFRCLELTGMPLRKCLKHASGVSEENLISLLKTLSSYGFQRSEIKAMLSKYPSLVKVKGPQVEQWFQYYSGLGFGRSVVTSLLLKRPALLTCDLKRASQVIDYLVSTGTRKEDLSAIIACRPHILEHDVAVVKSTVSALLKARLDQADINKLIKRAPTVFTLAQEDIERSLKFWSKVGVEGKALHRAILRRPNMLSYNTASMLSTYTYLQWWFEPSDLNKLVSRFAELLAYDPEMKLKPLINYFMELGLSEGEVAKVILRRPQLMTCTLERLKRVAEFLKSLGVKDDMVGKILITSPQVFTLNTEDKLKRGVEFFRSMGLDKARDMEFVFARSAQLFCCSIEKNLLPTFEFFANIGLEKEELATMIVAFPSMLGQSIELSLAPKYEYLIKELKRTKQELVEFPQYFGYSLEGRIKPRHRILAERGLSKSLPSMLACTDNDFHKRYTAAYSPLPYRTETICRGDATQRMISRKQKLKTKKEVVPPAKVQSEPVQQNPALPLASKQETVSVDHGPEVITAENQIDAMDKEWEFLNLIPQLHEQQSHLYPASFRKHYKTLTPCGLWIHAYKFDS
eukprot:c17733_g1_i1 orf=531-2783(+)